MQCNCIPFVGHENFNRRDLMDEIADGHPGRGHQVNHVGDGCTSRSACDLGPRDPSDSEVQNEDLLYMSN